MSDRSHPAEPEAVTPLKSQFADDADMIELVEYFISELGTRIAALREACAQGDFGRVRQCAHQLKGAAGGYGYPAISRSAGLLENAILQDEADLSAVHEKVEDLILLCRRAQAGA